MLLYAKAKEDVDGSPKFGRQNHTHPLQRSCTTASAYALLVYSLAGTATEALVTSFDRLVFLNILHHTTRDLTLSS